MLPAQGNVFVAGLTPAGNTTVQVGAEGPLRRRHAAGGAERACARGDSDAQPASDPPHRAHQRRRSAVGGGAATLSKAGRYVRVIDSIDPRGIDARASIIAHVNVLNRMTAAKRAVGVVADRHLFHRRSGRCSRTARRCSCSTFRQRTATATRSCSSAVRTSSAPAPSSTPPAYPRFDPARGRRHRRDHRRAQPRARHRRRRREPGRRHGRDSGPRPIERRNRRCQLPRHGDDRARPRACAGGEGSVPRAGPAGEADVGL